jgi:hypothetical protein
MTDHQQAPVRRNRAERIARLGCVKAARERRVDRQQGPLLLAPPLRRQLRGLARAHARAEQHHVEVSTQSLDCEAGGMRLLTPPLGQAALCIRARAMRLGLRVTK